MKKLLLISLIVFCIFQMVVMALEITMGNEAIDRIHAYGSGYTMVDRGNPANASGTITTVEIWAGVTIQSCEVAIFYVVSGNNLSTRSNQAIGTVLSGAKRTFVVDLAVEAGDYIGLKMPSGDSIQCVTDTPVIGVWKKFGDYIPCTNQTFSEENNVELMSIKGIGATPSVGWDGPFNTAAVTKWNTIELTKWNTIE